MTEREQELLDLVCSLNVLRSMGVQVCASRWHPIVVYLNRLPQRKFPKRYLGILHKKWQKRL